MDLMPKCGRLLIALNRALKPVMKSNFLLRYIAIPSLALALSSTVLGQDATNHTKKPGTTNWTNDADWDSGNSPGPADTAIIEDGTIEVSGAQSIARIRLNGGILVGATDSSTDSLTLTGTELNSQWSTASIQNITVLIGQNGALDLEGSSSKTLAASLLQILGDEVFGLTNWTGGQIQLNSGSQIQNSGDFNDSASSSLSTTAGSTGTFHNQSGGRYHKIAIGTTEVGVLFNNDGSVAVNQGTLKLAGGGLTSSTGSVSVASGAALLFDHNYSVSSGATLSGDGMMKLAAGTLTLDTAVDAKDFRIAGGVLSGTATFTNGANWTGGDLSNGNTTNAAGSTFTLNQTSGNNLSGHIFTNHGVTNWQTANLVLNNSSSFTNHGVFNDASSNSSTNTLIHHTAGPAGTFTNAPTGTYQKTTAGETEIDLNFSNQGLVNVTAGNLILDGTGTTTTTGGFNVTEGASLTFYNNYQIQNAANLSGGGKYHLGGGLLTLDGNVAVDFLQTAGGLTGTQNISGTWDWRGGLWLIGSTTIDSVGTLNIDGSNLTLDTQTLINNGLVDWQSGFISASSGSTISNTQTWNDNSTRNVADNYLLTNSVATSSFSNSGTYNKNGPGKSHIRVPFHNTGTLNIDHGDLELEAGGTLGATGQINTAAGASIFFYQTFDIPDASALTGDGSFVSINGSMDLQGTFSAFRFVSSNSSLTGDHNFESSVELDGTDWKDGSTDIGPLGSLKIIGHNGSSGTTLSNRIVTNQGSISWAEGDLVLDAGSSITNQGALIDQNTGASPDSRLYTATGDVGTFTNSATGSYQKQGADNTTFALPFANSGSVDIQAGKVTLEAGGFTANTGSIQIAAGATLDLPSDYTIDPAASVTGTGTLLHRVGTLSGGGEISPNFSQTSGVLDGDFNFSGQFNLSGGSIAANRNIGLTGETMSSIDAAGLELDGTTISVGNRSTLAWRGGNILTGNDGGLQVDGVMTTDFDGSILQTLGGTGGLTITGGFRKTSGTGNTTIAVPLNLSGRLEAHTGSIIISQPGVSHGGMFDVFAGAAIDFDNDFTFNDETSAQNGGSLNLRSGTFSINDNVDLGQNASVTGGTITGTHTLSGRIQVHGASFDDSGTTTISQNGRLVFDDPAGTPLNRSFVNDGELGWASGDFTGNGNNSLTNNGDFIITTDGTFSSASDDYSLINNGSIRKTDGTGTTTIDVPFTNNGLVTALTGIFHFTDTLTFGAGGKLGGGVKLDVPLILPVDSTLEGTGTITGNIVTGGKITPGNSIGALNIAGDLTLQSTANSFFEIDLNAVADPTDFLSVTGTLQLEGILTYEFLSFIIPEAIASSYTLITAGTLIGAFSNVAPGAQLFNNDLSGSFVVNYGSSSVFDSNSVVISNFTPVPEPSTFSLLVIGIGFIMWQTRRRRA